MTYFDHNRPQEPYQSVFSPQQAPQASPGAEDDRVFTEEDYALAPDGDAFLPDEAEDAYPYDYAAMPLEDDLYDEEGMLLDDDPLAEELLTDEERRELRRSTWQLLAGIGDFAGVILGTAVIFVLIALLVSLINWLISDVSQTFTLWQNRL